MVEAAAVRQCCANHFWLEQNPNRSSKGAQLARQGHEITWKFDSHDGSYTGRMLIDGKLYTE